MTLDDLRRFAPLLILFACLALGKLLKSAPKVPNWVIPLATSGLGLLSGCAMAALDGQDWKSWLFNALVGLVSGAGATGLHQAGQMLARKDDGVSGGTGVSVPKLSPDAAPAGTRTMRIRMDFRDQDPDRIALAFSKSLRAVR